ncbi:MAG: hypothetical protein M3094_11560, partial [Actinomycetia bacterium]|nr:hypothetical protein [Actinomycetes bacterium]
MGTATTITETIDRTAPQRRIPAYSPVRTNEVITSVYIVSTSDRDRDTTDYYRVRVGVSEDGRTEWVGEWDQSNNSLGADDRRDLTTQADFNYPLNSPQEVVIGLDKFGSPASLDGMKVEIKTALIGEVGDFQYPRLDTQGYPGARPMEKALFDGDPAFKGLDDLADSLNSAGVTEQTVTVQLTDLAVTPSYDGLVMAELLHVWHEETASTNGGAATSGSFETRTLNTETTNEIDGATLASNVITLPPGTYWLNGWCAGHACDLYKSRVYDITASATLIVGSSERATSSSRHVTRSTVSGRFTLAVESDLRLE